MAMKRSDRAASYLLDLRRGAPPPPSLPAELAPADEAEAYEVQRAVARTLGAAVGGWKVAMNTPSHGAFAPIFARDMQQSPARLDAPCAAGVGIEPEVAFKLGRDLPPLGEGRGYSRDQLREAIDSAHAAIEIVVSRYQSHAGAAPLARLADNISNGGLILSAPCAQWRSLELHSLPLRLAITAAGDQLPTLHQARGGHPLGDPLIPLLWLANDRAQSGEGLRAGDVITTGSYAGLHPAVRGAQVTVEFSGLGTVLLEVS